MSNVNVTEILARISSGEPHASDQLLPLVYEELRRLAAAKMKNEKPDHTLQATALVHEAYARLIGDGGADKEWENRGHFFSAAAEAMRRILVEKARSKNSERRGGGYARIKYDEAVTCANSIDANEAERILAVHEALTKLELESPQRAQLVKLRFFSGMTLEEIARLQGISDSSAYRDWALAKLWLYRHLVKND